jgi:hypothetical protein
VAGRIRYHCSTKRNSPLVAAPSQDADAPSFLHKFLCTMSDFESRNREEHAEATDKDS